MIRDIEMAEHPVGLDYLEQTLRNLGAFYFWPNDGNLGDYLIAEATRQFFRRSRLKWQEYNPENPPEEEHYNIVYGGGGRFVPHWGGVDIFQEHLTRPQVDYCVILPHSIRGVDTFVRAFDERHTIFCRDVATQTYCRALNTRAGFVLAHDMGLCLLVADLPGLETIGPAARDADEESSRQYELLTGVAASYARYRITRATIQNEVCKISFLLRTDKEKNTMAESEWAYDLSILYSASCRETAYSALLVRLMAELASYPDVVVTDRLHVAIMAMHVGKEVYMLDNDYGKLSGVYELSLKDRANVHLLPHGEPWPEEIQKAWKVLNAQEMKHAEPQRKVEGGALISVVVPVYNTAPWLRRCLDSIRGQTYRNQEILCVDDGSTDGSAEILAEYAAMDARIKVFTQPNAGLSAARNTALEHATGEWVTGVDSDDYLEPGVYERAMACASSEVDMVCYGVVEVNELGAPMPFNRYFDLPAAGEYEMTPALAEKLNVCFWSKLWRRSVLEEHCLRFPHGLVHEDEALYYLFAPYARKVAVCQHIGYHYVQRQGSIMNGDTRSAEARALRYVPVLEFVCKEYKRRDVYHTSRRAYLVKMFLRLCAGHYWNESVAAVFEACIRKSGVYYDNYLLERMLPVRGWQRLFLSRYPLSKVYRVFGVAVWAVFYSEGGMMTGHACMIFGRIKQLFK